MKNYPIFRNGFKERNYNVVSDTYFIFQLDIFSPKSKETGLIVKSFNI